MCNIHEDSAIVLRYDNTHRLRQRPWPPTSRLPQEWPDQISAHWQNHRINLAQRDRTISGLQNYATLIALHGIMHILDPLHMFGILPIQQIPVVMCGELASEMPIVTLPPRSARRLAITMPLSSYFNLKHMN